MDRLSHPSEKQCWLKRKRQWRRRTCQLVQDQQCQALHHHHVVSLLYRLQVVQQDLGSLKVEVHELDPRLLLHLFLMEDFR